MKPHLWTRPLCIDVIRDICDRNIQNANRARNKKLREAGTHVPLGRPTNERIAAETAAKVLDAIHSTKIGELLPGIPMAMDPDNEDPEPEIEQRTPAGTVNGSEGNNASVDAYPSTKSAKERKSQKGTIKSVRTEQAPKETVSFILKFSICKHEDQ